MKKILIGTLIWLLLSAPCYGAEINEVNYNKENLKNECIQRFIELKELLENYKKQKETVNVEKSDYKIFSVPGNSGFKSYMPYTAITSKNSPQYKLQHQYAYTGNYGIRQVNGRYCIALGTYYSKQIGTEIDLILKNGVVIPCILSDLKADRDTDSSNKVTLHNGCVAEFIVDRSSLYRMAKRMGDISYCSDDWNSPVKKIRVYDRNIFNTN